MNSQASWSQWNLGRAIVAPTGLAMLAALLTIAAGCGGSPSSSPTASAPASSAPPPPPLPPGPPAPPVPTNVPVAEMPVVEAPAGLDEATQSPAVAEGNERVKAQRGVGQKGRSLDEHEGIIVTPVKALFAAKERVVFEIQIPQAMALFNALEDRFPESHDEFMEKIIAANQIPLPQLPPNHKYIYVVDTHELMVERPKK